MQKFKPGDKVKLIEDYSQIYKKGMEFTVSGYDKFFNYIVQTTCGMSCYERRLELVKEKFEPSEKKVVGWGIE